MLDSYGPRVLPIQQLISCFGLLIMLTVVVFVIKKSVQYIDERRQRIESEPKDPVVSDSNSINRDTE